MVKDMAIHLELKRTEDLHLLLGKNWISRFLQRYPDLAFKLSTRLERQRAYANDQEVLWDYFGKLDHVIWEHSVEEVQIFNMDENGFLIELASRAKFLYQHRRRNPHVTHDGKGKLVIVIEIVGRDGLWYRLL